MSTHYCWSLAKFLPFQSLAHMAEMYMTWDFKILIVKVQFLLCESSSNLIAALRIWYGSAFKMPEQHELIHQARRPTFPSLLSLSSHSLSLLFNIQTRNIHYTMTDPSTKSLRYMPYPSRLLTNGTRPAQSSQDAGSSSSPSPAPLPSNSPLDAASVSSEPLTQLVLYNRNGHRPHDDESTPYAHPDKVRAVSGPAQHQFDEVISLHTLFEHHWLFPCPQEREKHLATEKELQFFRTQYAAAFQENEQLRECINARLDEPNDICPSNSLLLSDTISRMWYACLKSSRPKLLWLWNV